MVLSDAGATSAGFSMVPSDVGAPMVEVVARASFVLHFRGDAGTARGELSATGGTAPVGQVSSGTGGTAPAGDVEIPEQSAATVQEELIATAGTAREGDVEMPERSDSLPDAAATVPGELSATGGTAQGGDVSGGKNRKYKIKNRRHCVGG